MPAPKPTFSMGGNAFNPSEVYDTLRAQDVLPAWERTDTTTTGAYAPGRNVVKAPLPNPRVPGTRDTAAHELSHGMQNLIANAASLLRERQWNREKLDPVEQQFLNTYLKTMGALPGRVGQFDSAATTAAQAGLRKSVAAMGGGMWKQPDAPEGAGYSAYRTAPGELQAWGVGLMSDPTSRPARQPLHLNPSFATEFAILMDNYKRLPLATQQAAAGQMRQRAAEAESKATGLEALVGRLRRVPAPYGDPFK